jgi:hypothetical protein
MDDFATNSALPTPVVEKPAIWAHLFALDKWAPYCGADVHAQPHGVPTAYHMQSTFNVRFKNAADGVALIAAIGRDASHVSACTFEAVVDNPGSLVDSPLPVIKYVIRVAKNGAFPPSEVQRLRTLFENIVERVDAVDWNTVGSNIS